MPVIFVPPPPRYLALPRWVTSLPNVVFLPVKWHTRGMAEPQHGYQQKSPRRRTCGLRRGNKCTETPRPMQGCCDAASKFVRQIRRSSCEPTASRYNAPLEFLQQTDRSPRYATTRNGPRTAGKE